MNDIDFTFDDLLTMKALQLKASVSGHGNTALIGQLLERDTEQAEAIGMKNMCFRVHPVLQARFESVLNALDMSKQEALTEAIQDMVTRADEKLRQIGLGPVSYDARLRELGFELGAPDKDGSRKINRVAKERA
jgi:hypothetical protein